MRRTRRPHAAVLPSLPAAPAAGADDAARRAHPRFSEPPAERAGGACSPAVGATHPVRVFLVVVVAGYALLVGADDRRRASCSPAARCRWTGSRRGTTTQPLARRAPRLRRSPTSPGSARRSPGGLVIPVVVGVLLVVFPRQAALAPRRVHAVRDLRRVGLLPGDDARRRARPTPCPSPGGARSDCELPSGHIAATVALYGGLLLSARLVDRHAAPFSALARSHSRRARALSSAGHGCTAGCTTSPTAPRACSMGSSRSWSRFSPRGAADRRRERAGRRAAASVVKNVAVIAHAGKTIGGGLEELRRELAARRC